LKCVCGHDRGIHGFADFVNFNLECREGVNTPNACTCKDFTRKNTSKKFKVNDWVAFDNHSGIVDSIKGGHAFVKVNGIKAPQKVAVSKLRRFA